jgi:hypothetical protein
MNAAPRGVAVPQVDHASPVHSSSFKLVPRFDPTGLASTLAGY